MTTLILRCYPHMGRCVPIKDRLAKAFMSSKITHGTLVPYDNKKHEEEEQDEEEEDDETYIYVWMRCPQRTRQPQGVGV
jgi:hypothetical protein